VSSDLAVSTLAEALRKRLLHDLDPGSYRIEYNDQTHLAANEWRAILDVEIRGGAGSKLAQEGYPLYTVAPVRQATAAPSKGKEKATRAAGAEATRGPADKGQEQAQRDQAKILDVLGQCLTRAGVLPATTEPDITRLLHKVGKRGALVVIPDTNAIANGTAHYLVRALNRLPVWLMPVAISLTTIQEHDRRLKGLVNKHASGNLSSALRSRSLVNSALSILERCRARAQIVEVEPQLLRFMRPPGKEAADPDQGDVLEDRLLVEAIHALLGAMRTQAQRFVLTSDVFLARILRAEGIPTLAMQPGQMSDGPIPCVRYDALARAFAGATLPELLWELAHSFASVRLVGLSDPKRPLARLDTYWAGKTDADWRNEAVKLTLAARDAQKALSSAPLPEAPMPKMLRLAGAILQEPSSLDDARHRIPEPDRPSEDTARAAVTVLARAGFLSYSDGVFATEEPLHELDRALAARDLDAASRLWEQKYPPYGALLEHVRRSPTTEMSVLPDLLRDVVGKTPAQRSCEHLARAAVYLGQAWISSNRLFDGTTRLSDTDAARKIMEIFDSLKRDNQLGVDELLTKGCELLRMSPWALSSQLRKLVESKQLPAELRLSPALGSGRTPLSPVPVLQGSLADLREEPVPLDRLKLGHLLMYTLTWSQR